MNASANYGALSVNNRRPATAVPNSYGSTIATRHVVRRDNRDYFFVPACLLA